jgi:ABC-type uncharacterized transport system ATPase subunit
VLVIAGLSGLPAAGRAPRPGITVTVREREIVAIVGADGNGQDRIVEAVAGLFPSRVRHGDAVRQAGRGRRLPALGA